MQAHLLNRFLILFLYQLNNGLFMFHQPSDIKPSKTFGQLQMTKLNISNELRLFSHDELASSIDDFKIIKMNDGNYNAEELSSDFKYFKGITIIDQTDNPSEVSEEFIVRDEKIQDPPFPFISWIIKLHYNYLGESFPFDSSPILRKTIHIGPVEGFANRFRVLYNSVKFQFDMLDFNSTELDDDDGCRLIGLKFIEIGGEIVNREYIRRRLMEMHDTGECQLSCLLESPDSETLTDRSYLKRGIFGKISDLKCSRCVNGFTDDHCSQSDTLEISIVSFMLLSATIGSLAVFVISTRDSSAIFRLFYTMIFVLTLAMTSLPLRRLLFGPMNIRFRLAMTFCAYCLAHRAIVRFYRISSQMLRSICIGVVFYSIDTCMHLLCYFWLFSDWDGESSEQFSKALTSRVVSAVLIVAQFEVTRRYCRESTRSAVIKEQIQLRELPRSSRIATRGEQAAEAESSLSTNPAPITKQTQLQELPSPSTKRKGQAAGIEASSSSSQTPKPAQVESRELPPRLSSSTTGKLAAEIEPLLLSTSTAHVEERTQSHEPPLQPSPIPCATRGEPAGETEESSSTASQQQPELESILRSWFSQPRSLPYLDWIRSSEWLKLTFAAIAFSLLYAHELFDVHQSYYLDSVAVLCQVLSGLE